MILTLNHLGPHHDFSEFEHRLLIFEAKSMAKRCLHKKKIKRRGLFKNGKMKKWARRERYRLRERRKKGGLKFKGEKREEKLIENKLKKMRENLRK